MKYRWPLRTFASLIVACGLGQATPGAAAPLNISSTPLFLGLKVEPNVMLSIDDSGSMDWEIMSRDAANDGRYTGTQPNGTSPAGSGNPRHRDANENGSVDCDFNDGTFYGYLYIVEFPDNTYADDDYDCNTADEQEWRMRNFDFNPLYFNPNRAYLPWAGVDKNGTPYTDMLITAAKSNPYDPASHTIDLTRHNSNWNGGTNNRTTSDRDRDGVADGFRYYTWNDNNGNGLFDNGEETAFLIKNADATTKQNFANWFSYYRSREFVAKAAYSEVIANAINVRMGLVTLHNQRNGINTAVTSVNTPIRSLNVDPTTGNKRSLMDALFSIQSNNGTPLRPALKSIGQYLQCDSARTLFSTHCPALSVAQGGECQQNFVIFMTDGFDNGGSPSVGNTDTDGAGAFDGGAYADSYSNTLADVAMHYYERDLQTSLGDKVPKTPGVDDAGHQHMVTYTMSFGLDGFLSGDPPNRTSPFAWPDPFASSTAKIDDLRHAAFNGRGLFLSARNPQQLSSALQDVFRSIAERTSSAASVALNSGAYNSGSRVYQARFNSGDWSGQLLSYPINSDGSVGTPEWDAGAVLDTQNYNTGRVMLTYKPSTRAGIALRWANLDAAQQTVLQTNSAGTNDGQGSARLEYLRGSRAHEAQGNRYRVRLHVLGDLINSDPYYVGEPPFPDSLGAGYIAFRTANANRTPMVYVGSNDGFMHGFDSTSGQELLAYLPNSVFANTNQLTSTTYGHRYYVDGSPTIGDVELNRSGTTLWRSILVGGLRAGGQGYYALDVTDPSTFRENNANNIVLWEFSDTHDVDLGFTYSQPSIVRMANGRWAAVFGNGYNNTVADGRASTTGRAMLFIVFLDGGLDGVWTPGVDYIKIDTQVGDTTTPNGLSTPTPIDTNNDYTAEYIVAGDLRGNMWTFDVTDPNPVNWRVPYTSSGKPAPLYVARDANGVAQPITVRPEVWRHPDRLHGFVVYFGTGKYLEAVDDNPVGATTQTVYALWDNGSGPIASRSNLLRQEVLQVTTLHGNSVRLNSDYPIDWALKRGWYLDLPTLGEKQVSDPVLREGRLIFTTLIPDTDVCSYGGTSWIMILNANNGGRFKKPQFDLDEDHAFTNADMAPRPPGSSPGTSSLVSVSGLASTEGILPSPAVLAGENSDQIYLSGSSGDIVDEEIRLGARGRLGWLQLL